MAAAIAPSEVPSAVVNKVHLSAADERACAIEIFTRAGRVEKKPAAGCKHIALGLFKRIFRDVPFNWGNIMTGMYQHIDTSLEQVLEVAHT